MRLSKHFETPVAKLTRQTCGADYEMGPGYRHWRLPQSPAATGSLKLNSSCPRVIFSSIRNGNANVMQQFFNPSIVADVKHQPISCDVLAIYLDESFPDC